MAAVLILSGGSAWGEDAPRIKGWVQAQTKFRAWQQKTLQRRAQPTEQMKRIFYHKTIVPPPSLPGSAARGGIWQKIKYHTRYDYSIFDPMGLAPGMPDLGVGSGDPTVKVNFKVQAGLLKLRMLSHDITLFAVGPGSDKAFGDAKTVMKTGLLGAPLSRYGIEAEAAFSSQLTGHGFQSTGPTAALGGSYGIISGAVKLGLDTDVPVVGASIAVGPKLVPERYSDIAQATMAVEADVSMPVVIEDIQWKSKHGVSQVASRAAVKITRMLRRPMDCPYCRRLGEVTCRQCANRRTIDCAACKGSGRAPCRPCGGSGKINCPTKESCPSCRGWGRLPCTRCGSTGRVNVQKKYTEQVTRSYKVPVTAGFDSNGDPIVQYRTQYRTVDVSRWETESILCSTCGGVGRLGTCRTCSGSGRITCRRCRGRGWNACRPCGGSGEVACRRCDGSGRVTCPTCRGRKIVCPLCRGSKRIGVGR